MMTSSRYQQALDYLYSFVDYSVKRSYRYSPEVFDLERVRRLLRALDNPQDKYATIHIAGTKGKGSVSALISSVLQAAGYRTALYTSPHLISLTERMQINGVPIAEERVADLVEQIKPHVALIDQLTAYELITAIGFLYFAEEQVDWAVIEVGLGGRLDATNVVMPNVAVITSLSYDHMHILGDSLSEIAGEKAGIIKPNVPVVLAPQQIEAELVVEEVAEGKNARLTRVGQDWLFAPGPHNLRQQTFFIWSAAEQPLVDSFIQSAGVEEWVPPKYETPLLGYHQVINAAVAYATLKVIDLPGFKVSEQDIRRGFRNVRWPGRFQILSHKPVVVVDSAHNRESALKLRIALDDYFPGRRVTLIFGAFGDKDVSGMFAELLPRIAKVIITRSDHERAAETDELVSTALSHGGRRVEVKDAPAEALRYALENAHEEDVILVAGSLSVAGEVLSAWDTMKSIPEEDQSG